LPTFANLLDYLDGDRQGWRRKFHAERRLRAAAVLS